jgi:rubredoxin
MICPTCGHDRETVDPARCAHDFEEIELGGMGKIMRCRLCGLCDGRDRDQKSPGDDPRSPIEKKRKRFRIVVPKQPFKTVLAIGMDIIELEEVE